MTDQSQSPAIVELNDEEQKAVTGGASSSYHETPDGPEFSSTEEEGPFAGHGQEESPGYIGSAYPIFLKS